MFEHHLLDDSHFALCQLSFDIDVAILVDKYNIPGLGQHAATKYKERAEVSWDTEEFVRSIEKIYSLTSDATHDIQPCTVAVAAEHGPELMKRRAEFYKVAKTVVSRSDTAIAEARVYVSRQRAPHLCSLQR